MDRGRDSGGMSDLARVLVIEGDAIVSAIDEGEPAASTPLLDARN